MRSLLPQVNIDIRSRSFKVWALLGLVAITFLAVVILIWKINAMTLTSVESMNGLEESNNNFGIVFNIFGKLTLVVGLIYLIYAVYRSFQQKVVGKEKHLLSIKETMRLSSHQSLHIVQVGTKKFLVGATDQTMSLLAQLEDADSEKKDSDPIAPTNEPINKVVDFTSILESTVANPAEITYPSLGKENRV